MRSNKAIVNAAGQTITTAGLAAGGALNPEQAQKFIQQTFEATPLSGLVRHELRKAKTGEIDKIGVGRRLLRKKTENTDDGYRSGVKHGKLEYACTPVRLPWEITEETLRENIEGSNYETIVTNLMTRQIGCDREDLCLNGDERYAKVKEFHKDHISGEPREFSEMVKWYKAAADLGDWRSGYEYGKWMISNDPLNAEKYLLKAVSKGNGDAAWILCQAYKTGNNLSQNLKAVPKYLKIAADKGVDDACYWLGMYYMQGYLVPRNYPLAVKYFKKVNGGQYIYRCAPMLYQLRKKGYK